MLVSNLFLPCSTLWLIMWRAKYYWQKELFPKRRIVNQCIFLKGVWHETFSFWFLSQINFPHGPEYPVRAISNCYENSRIFVCKGQSPVSMTPAIIYRRKQRHRRQFIAGVVDTGDKQKIVKISANFYKNLKRPQWDPQGPGGNKFMEESHVRLPLINTFSDCRAIPLEERVPCLPGQYHINRRQIRRNKI
jgi:hypothetical protein